MNSIGPLAAVVPNQFLRPAVETEKSKQSENPPSSDEIRQSDGASRTDSDATTKTSQYTAALTDAEKQQVADLKARDAEVRAHEAAHKAAGGSLTGPATFTHRKGPDGKRYAVGGEVSVDTSPVSGNPQATLLKANRIHAAATAPVNPSSQDRAVAANALAMANDARVEIHQEQLNTKSKDNDRGSEETATTGNNDNEEEKTEKEMTPHAAVRREAQQAYISGSTSGIKSTSGLNIDLLA